MGQTGKILLICLMMLMSTLYGHSALRGTVDYAIPIDYTKLSESELSAKAEFYYDRALNVGNDLNDDMTSALNLYSVLKNKNPDNLVYSLRLGKLYDILGKDRYAKGNYYHAMGVNSASPLPCYYLGDYFYERSQYRKALKMYKRALENGYESNAQMLEKMEVIKKKLGQTEKEGS